VAEFMVISRHLPGGTDENHEKLQLEYPASGSRFEIGTAPIQSSSANYSVATLGFTAPRNTYTFSFQPFVFRPEDGGSMFLRNNGIYLHIHKALQTRKKHRQFAHCH
jgi:hypothetical protein